MEPNQIMSQPHTRVYNLQLLFGCMPHFYSLSLQDLFRFEYTNRSVSVLRFVTVYFTTQNHEKSQFHSIKYEIINRSKTPRIFRFHERNPFRIQTNFWKLNFNGNAIKFSSNNADCNGSLSLNLILQQSYPSANRQTNTITALKLEITKRRQTEGQQITVE